MVGGNSLRPLRDSHTCDSRLAKPVVPHPSVTFIHKLSIATLVQSYHRLPRELLLGCVCQGTISDGGLAGQHNRSSPLMVDVDVNHSKWDSHVTRQVRRNPNQLRTHRSA
jgi:hypothetical protein